MLFNEFVTIRLEFTQKQARVSAVESTSLRIVAWCIFDVFSYLVNSTKIVIFQAELRTFFPVS